MSDLTIFQNQISELKSHATLDYLNRLGKHYFSQTMKSFEQLFGFPYLDYLVSNIIANECRINQFNQRIGAFEILGVHFKQHEQRTFPLEILKDSTIFSLEKMVENYKTLQEEKIHAQFNDLVLEFMSTLDFADLRKRVILQDNYQGYHHMGVTTLIYYHLYPIFITTQSIIANPFFTTSMFNNLDVLKPIVSNHLACINKTSLVGRLPFYHDDMQKWAYENNMFNTNNQPIINELHQLQNKITSLNS